MNIVALFSHADRIAFAVQFMEVTANATADELQNVTAQLPVMIFCCKSNCNFLMVEDETTLKLLHLLQQLPLLL